MNKYFTDVLIIGAGISGLACARALKEHGCSSIIILEATDKIGGRVATDYSDGFLLDHGFQVLIDGYPEVKRLGIVHDLRATCFAHGSIIRIKNNFYHLPDPFRHPSKAISALFSPAITFVDKLRLALLRMNIHRMPVIANETTYEYLKRLKFSDKAIQHFFQPFFGGVFLENNLNTPANKFTYLFDIFKKSNILLPEQGIGAISKILASPLDQSSILLKRRVVAINRYSDNLGVVYTEDETFEANKIILTSANLEGLLPDSIRLPSSTSFNSVSCLYFSATFIPYPLNLPYLILNTNGSELILHMCCLSNIQPSYSPRGSHLISVTVINNSQLTSLEIVIREELEAWFGKSVDGWQLLKIFHIEHAIPQGFPNNPICIESPWLYRAGDYVLEATLNGALKSAWQVADEIYKNSI